LAVNSIFPTTFTTDSKLSPHLHQQLTPASVHFISSPFRTITARITWPARIAAPICTFL
jgi:hypothetical protein